jgi:hypothetical protein
MKDNATHILVRNLGLCEDWESFNQFITPELMSEYKLKVIDLLPLRLDLATKVYKKTLSFTDAPKYSEFSTAQLAVLMNYLEMGYKVLNSAGFNIERLRSRST